MVDTLVLGTSAIWRGGSSPLSSTNYSISQSRPCSKLSNPKLPSPIKLASGCLSHPKTISKIPMAFLGHLLGSDNIVSF